MSWLGTVLFFAMYGGVILMYRGFVWFDRAYDARARGAFVTVQLERARVFDIAGCAYCVIGVILIASGGLYFRLGGI